MGLYRTVALVLVIGCGSAPPHIEIGPPPAKQTTVALAGPLCSAGRCKCREGAADGGAGFPDGDRKRFEVRLGPSPQALWLTTPDGVIYKDPERAEECFYIDLGPGPHQVELRGSAPEGVSAALTIRELGTRTKSWYDTFKFACGSPGVCSYDELDENKTKYAAAKGGVQDPCGSVKIKGLIWDQGHAPDQLHPSEVAVRLTLDVYKFSPWKPHGDSCEHMGRPPKDEAGAAEPAPPEPAPANGH